MYFCTKKKLSFLILSMLLILFSVVAFGAPDGKNLEVSVKAGYEDVVRVGSQVPFYISITNKGDEFSGEAQVLVDNGYRSKMIYALPFTAPKGTPKEIVMNVPVSTANRKVEIRIAAGEKILKKVEYTFKKLIAPETPVIGVLSDDKTGLRILNGIKLSESLDQMHPEEAQKIRIMMAAGEMAPTTDRAAELIGLSKDTLPDNMEAFSSFDYIVIADYDTSLLSDAQKKALEAWVDKGHTLLLGTGPNGKKVYKGLSDTLKPFTITGEKTIAAPFELQKFVERVKPEGDITVSVGSANGGYVIAGTEADPLAVLYKKGEGKIVLLSFDPTISPISNWKYVDEMWKRLFNSNFPNGSVIDMKGLNFAVPRMYHGGGIVEQVPEDQTPPYGTLLIVIALYIIIVGPILYIFLKKKDKRDWNWVVIPAMAFLCMSIIYVAGFKTRYTTAVVNNFSVINIDPTQKKLNINTQMASFNNQRGNMKIEYPDSMEISINSNRDQYANYYGYNPSPDDEENAIVNSKLLMGNPRVHEQYNVPMWAPIYMWASKSGDIQGDIISDVNINNGKFTAIIRNGTGFDFKEAFICVGNNLIDIGDVLPGSEPKKIEVDLKDSSKVNKSFDDFINKRYPYTPYSYNGSKNTRPKDWREQLRKRSAFEEVFRNNQNYNSQNGSNPMEISFYALNFDEITYDFNINDKKPKVYNTNVVCLNQDLPFEKGKKIELAAGIINATFESGENVGLEGYNGESIRVQGNTDVILKFVIPKGLEVTQFRIDWSASIPIYLKEQFAQRGIKQEEQFPNERYKLFIYNNSSSNWEKITEVFEPKGDLKSYINGLGEIRVKANVTLDGSSNPEEFMWKPEIQLSGVVK